MDLKSREIHSKHDILEHITDEMLKKPIKHILKPIGINSSNAVC